MKYSIEAPMPVAKLDSGEQIFDMHMGKALGRGETVRGRQPLTTGRQHPIMNKSDSAAAETDGRGKTRREERKRIRHEIQHRPRRADPA
jgi:hypothetical protein